MSICKICNRKFGSEQALQQHKQAKHLVRRLVCDENCSPDEAKIRAIAQKGYQVDRLKTKLLGRKDHVILNWLKQTGSGLITRDRALAAKAQKVLSEVFLI